MHAVFAVKKQTTNFYIILYCTKIGQHFAVLLSFNISRAFFPKIPAHYENNLT